MRKITSRSKVFMGILFAMSGVILLAGGKMLLGGMWLFCSAVHFFYAYRIWKEEKSEK